MLTETITWHEVAEQMPDADLTVLIRLADDESEPVWIGWWDGERWYDALGTVVEVVRWAELPVGEARDGTAGVSPSARQTRDGADAKEE